MKVFLLILSGVAGGVLGGMGLGGGTLLIPILVFFMKLPPRLAAWTNLVCFLPTAIVAVFFHAKNKMIDFAAARSLLFFALIGAAGVLLFAGDVSDAFLRKGFGCFLLCLGAISLFAVLLGYFRRK